MGQCPSSFLPAGFGACVRECPGGGQFEQSALNGQYQCIYKGNRDLNVALTPIPWIQSKNNQTIPPIKSLDELKTISPELYPKYKAEADRVDQEISVVMAKIGKEQKVKDAFVRLQETENARDSAPDAYQQARTMYYTLVKGDAWRDEERQRIARTEVAPVIQQYKTNKDNALKQFNAQKQTMEVVSGVKDRVLSLKDEFKYSVDTFSDQLGKLQDQINKERRGRQEETKVSIWDWLDTILNIAIIASLIYAALTIYPILMRRPAQQRGYVVR